jgi:hypothetical protein
VWSITPNLRYAASLGGALQVDPWLDLDVAAVSEEAKIAAFRFVTETGTVELRHLEEAATTPAPEGETGEPATTVTWKVVAPEEFEADPGIVRALRSSVRKIRASAVVDPAGIAGYGLEPPKRSLEIEIEDAEPVIVDFGEAGALDESRLGFYARRRGDDRIFFVPTWTADGLIKTLDQLRPAEKPPVAPSAPAAPTEPVAPPPRE